MNTIPLALTEAPPQLDAGCLLIESDRKEVF